jgi:hypothetical protein
MKSSDQQTIDDPKKGTYKAYKDNLIATMLKLRYDFLRNG